MKNHTTFRIGGPADYFVTPKDEKEIAAVIEICKKREIPYYIVGNGSNLLVGDKGYRGVVIQIFKTMNHIRVSENEIYAAAGSSLAQIASAALAAELTGFEFAAGIPGTIGGAVVMNAGAYGGEMKDILKDVEVLTPDGEIKILSLEELDLSYRHSCIFENDYIVLSVHLHLEQGDKTVIRNRMDELARARREKQPLEYPSAGSTFKRPAGYFAGALIQDAGLKGYTVGGAQVSEKHSGFVINRGGATAEEVLFLIKQVQKKVKSRFGVTMEPEVRMVGFTDTEVKL